MGPPKSGASRRPSKDTHSREGKKSEKKSSAASLSQHMPQGHQQEWQQQRPTGSGNENQNKIDISGTIPLPLQQLLLNTFKAALLPCIGPPQDTEDTDDTAEESKSDIKALIQTLKSHLYKRDFESAFADASEELLRAYALRWSAARALGYAGLFKSLLRLLIQDQGCVSDGGSTGLTASPKKSHIVCIGGGAGAEIVALAAAWRDLMGELSGLSDVLGAVSLDTGRNGQGKGSMDGLDQEEARSQSSSSRACPSLLITAVDIGDWSTVVRQLSSTLLSPTVPSSKSHPAPLLPAHGRDINAKSDIFSVNFKRLDVLSLSDSELSSLYHSRSPDAALTRMVTLMFTLNELFSTSIPKATAFLLKTTDLLQPGTILLVVDSPGSYSTLKLGKGSSSGTAQERQYPMKFLLDHALLSVAKGKWERIFSQDSKWWRRDAARLWYDVGNGAGLEDMRFQIHVYRKLG
ncbi:25S rRNA (uracil2843-N3)-methyltransferase [Aspergillus lucknowensis]|uniref:25S rRNA (Uridine(2843)-N(3))-methyltransferase n=1 Tax=Aspergillus lucknowensis TaxID=176173 RepID=A0ABR4LXR8_9EURO